MPHPQSSTPLCAVRSALHVYELEGPIISTQPVREQHLRTAVRKIPAYTRMGVVQLAEAPECSWHPILFLHNHDGSVRRSIQIEAIHACFVTGVGLRCPRCSLITVPAHELKKVPVPAKVEPEPPIHSVLPEGFTVRCPAVFTPRSQAHPRPSRLRVL